MFLSENISKIISKVFLFFAFFLILGSIFFLSKLPVSSDQTNNLQAGISSPIQDSLSYDLQPEKIIIQDKEDDFQISAKSAISVEVGSNTIKNILFKKNEKERLPVASLLKIMTALVILEKYDLNQDIVISDLAMKEEGEQGVLKAGQVLSVENLLYIMLIESSNRAAFALSEVVGNSNFINLMNEESERLGLANTHFSDVTGLSGESYSTAEDISILSDYIFSNYPLFAKIINLKEYDLYLKDGTLHHKLENTNELLGKSGIIGGKTGYTINAKGCFMTIQKKSESNYTINIVLGSDNRFLDMESLVNFLDNKYLTVFN